MKDELLALKAPVWEASRLLLDSIVHSWLYVFFGYLTVKTASVIVMESYGSCVKKNKMKTKTNDPNYTKPKHQGSIHKLTPLYGQYLSQVLS